MSGICLAQAGLGIVHGFASPIGGYFDIPHGVVCGTLLGACTRINIDRLRNDPSLKKYPAKYADAGRLLTDINGKDDIYYTSLLSDTLDKWVEELKLPRLSHYGITATDFDRIIAGTGNKNNPVKLTKEDMRTILGMRL